MAVTIEEVITAPGVGANYCEDLGALRAGHVRVDGEFHLGRVSDPAFNHVKEPGEALSLMLLLSDGQVAHGDCVSVVYAGFGGRDPVFRAGEAARAVQAHLVPALVGQEVRRFRELAEMVETLTTADDVRLHSGVRYGASQALLHAASLATKQTMTEVICDEYRLQASTAVIPVLAQSGRDRYGAVDRMIQRQVPVIPHGDFTSVEEIGPRGERLLEYLSWMKDRVLALGEKGYRPSFHLDLYGSLGRALNMEVPRLVAYLLTAEELAAPHPIAIESPVLGNCRGEVIDVMARLTRELERQESSLVLVADEFCNGLDDIRAFADARAAHMIQIKLPDLGSITSAIEAVAICRDRGLLVFVGGSCNETDWNARVSVHLAIATAADRMYAKPGFGVDEGDMVTRNEMSRTLAILEASERRRQSES